MTLVTGCCAEPSEFITQTFTTKFVFSVSLPSSARDEVNEILVVLQPWDHNLVWPAATEDHPARPHGRQTRQVGGR